jgi:hypothetical protein
MRRLRRPIAVCLLPAFLLTFAWGCGSDTTPTSTGPALLTEEHAADQEIMTKLSKIINDTQIKYWPLRYNFAEDLLERLDQIEAHLSSRPKGPAPRFIPKLSEQEEWAHYRETIRRWEAQTSKSMRAEIDRLKASVAARKPGERFHPEWQKDFSETFNDFKKIEIEEMRERRNHVIHEEAEKLFAEYRAKHPGLVRRFEATLSAPPYDLPSKAQAAETPRGAPPADHPGM